MSKWTLFSNHGHVLFCLVRNSEARLRDVAADVGITERAVQKIVRDLQLGGMISVTKNGRRNCYRIHKKQPLRHSLESDCKIRDLIKVVVKTSKSADSIVAPVSEPEAMKSSADPVPSTNKQALSPASGLPEPKTIEPKPQKKSETESSKLSDVIEKQQGSLF